MRDPRTLYSADLTLLPLLSIPGPEVMADLSVPTSDNLMGGRWYSSYLGLVPLTIVC